METCLRGLVIKNIQDSDAVKKNQTNYKMSS